MGLFKRVRDKWEERADSILLEPTPSLPDEQDIRGRAEQIAAVVEDGLDSANYAAMNERLSSIANRKGQESPFVFRHPNVAGEIAALVFFGAFLVLALYLVVIGLATVVLSGRFFAESALIAIPSALIVAANVVLVGWIAAKAAYAHRYSVYADLLGYKAIEFIEDIASCSKRSDQRVVKDLQIAIRQGLIPQGRFSTDNVAFMVSDAVYAEYEKDRVAYDRYFKKKLDERRKAESRPEYVVRMLDDGRRYLQKLQGYEKLVKSKAVAKRIGEIEHIASKVFREVEVDSGNALLLGTFLDYYIPVSEKLLDAYMELEEKQASGESASRTKDEIEGSLTALQSAFEGILEKIYHDYEMDVVAEVEAMELSMNQEGLSVSDAV